MNWLKPVLIRWSSPFLPRLVVAREQALRVAGGGTWLAVAVLAAVALWGWVDPFGLRQRLDWMVADQFYRRRTPPAIHSDLLQVSIDDRAADELGYPVPRHLYARALRQLQALGARTVMIDVLFSDPQERVALEHADRLLIPRAAVVGDLELSRRFSEDQVLADAMAEVDQLVLSYFVPVPYQISAADERTRDAMSDRLLESLARTPAELSALVKVDAQTARRLFEPALRLALARLARESLRANPAISNEEAAAAFQDAHPAAAGFVARYVRALDRERADALLRQKASFGDAAATPPQGDTATQHDELQAPVFAITQAADYLGFYDAEEDADGRIRRLPLVKRRGGLLLHELLLASLLQVDVKPRDVQLAGGRLGARAGRVRIPLDDHGCMTINWPMSDARHWSLAIPQISLNDLIALDRYELDLAFIRYKLREYAGILDAIVPTGDSWNRQVESILTAYAAGDVAKAAERERKFDRDGLPRILNQPQVRAAIERAGQFHDLTAIPADDRLTQVAREVLDFQSKADAIETEWRSVRSDLHARVNGKLCLIGDTTTGSADLKQTPVGSDVPGISVIAAAINTLLTGNFPRVTAYPVSALAMLVIAAGLAVPFLRLRPLAAGSGALAGAVVAIYGSYGLLAAADTVVSPVTPVAGIVLLYVATTTYQWLSEYRQRKLVRSIFEAQTNPTIVERLIEAGQAGVEEVLTPKTRQVTVFFAEIADFEELSQRTAPERLPEILARVFGTLNKVVQAHEGTLDRYQGQAMVAFFGAPIYQPDHAQRACRAALECCDTLAALAGSWKERGLPEPRVQVGLHTGELLVGNITLTSRVDYTVAGENLNVAYRIGELNETYGTQIMISEATLARCEMMVEARELDLVRIKGRREPIRAYELMTAKGRLTPHQLQLRGTFSTGLVAFRNKDYSGALAMFRNCRETAPSDRPATVYIERCEKQLKQTVVEPASNSEALTVLPTEPMT